MIAQARRRLAGEISHVIADAGVLPFPDDHFNVVISTRFLHLFPPHHQRQFLSEMMRVLRPGGRLIVDFDNFSSRWLLAVPHLLYNLARYRRLAPEAFYNRVSQVEQTFAELGVVGVRSIGIGGYHLVVPAIVSRSLALRLGSLHRGRPGRFMAEQFVTTGTKVA
jgi:SAM-dependent methyltransferase